MAPRVATYEQSDTPPSHRAISAGTGIRLTVGQCVTIAIPLVGAIFFCSRFYLAQAAQGERIERIERILRVLAEKQGIVIP